MFTVFFQISERAVGADTSLSGRAAPYGDTSVFIATVSVDANNVAASCNVEGPTHCFS
jgi:hypothetical protein